MAGFLAGALGAGVLTSGAVAAPPADDWPSYNRTPTSERFAPQSQITRANVAGLRPICAYDLGAPSNLQAGPIVISGVLYVTAENALVAIDAKTCVLKWRTVEPIGDGQPPKVNRGVAYLDGRLFRAMQDGRLVAYSADTGTKVWEARFFDPAIEGASAAPLAWGGMVFIGNSGGDRHSVKGRMYAFDAATGRRLWETYLVPNGPPDPAKRFPDIAKTWGNAPSAPISGGATWTAYSLDPTTGVLWIPSGNPAPDFAHGLRPGANLFTNSAVGLDAKTGVYRDHYSIVPADFHDWDVSAAPSVITTRAGRRLLSVAPKDGLLYGFDLTQRRKLYATPVTTIENAAAPLTAEGVRFCPGTLGGSEWNGPAYNPINNLIYSGAVDWCTTVALGRPEEVLKAAPGARWPGSAPGTGMGKNDPQERWAGWVTAVDADSGAVRWRFKAPAPVLAGVTPTAGGLVFSADMAGNAYALDSETGKVLWHDALSQPTGGGVISYSVGGDQRVAFVVGVNSAIWTPDKRNGRIVVYGLR